MKKELDGMRTMKFSLDLGLAPGVDEEELSTRLHRALHQALGENRAVQEFGQLDPSPRRFKWIVEIEVDRKWVADGFDLTDEGVHDLLARRLDYAYSEEFGGRVLSAPDPRDVRAAQGYQDED